MPLGRLQTQVLPLERPERTEPNTPLGTSGSVPAAFEITFLGSSGGPVEASNCAVLVKPAALSYSQVLKLPHKPLVLVDAGAGLLLLAELVADDVRRPARLLLLYSDSVPVDRYMKVVRTHPFRDLPGAPISVLNAILSKVGAVLISHPHLDHVLALVLNLPAMDDAAPCGVYGSAFTMDALQTHLFNGVVWPDMVHAGVLQLNVVEPLYETRICGDTYSVVRFPLSHGRTCSSETYESLAFLLTCTDSGAKILIFGDFEVDSVLRLAHNHPVWRHVAPFVLDGSLRCVVLECSMPNAAPEKKLYGHFKPCHLIQELAVLAAIVGEHEKMPLRDLHVVVTHVKENIQGADPRRTIQNELEELNCQAGLGARFTMALCGVSFVV